MLRADIRITKQVDEMPHEDKESMQSRLDREKREFYSAGGAVTQIGRGVSGARRISGRAR